MARLKGVASQFEIAMAATLEQTHQILVETARREHAKIMADDPRPGAFRRWVDGVQGASEAAVKPFGVIEYQYQRLDLVVQFALETLFDLSPVLSGDYRLAHTLFLNDLAVPNLRDWKPGDVVGIVNFLPYARVIEHGKMKMRVTGTDRVYAQAERIVLRRFGNLAKTRFTYRGIIDGVAAEGTSSDVRYPALIISERN